MLTVTAKKGDGSESFVILIPNLGEYDDKTQEVVEILSAWVNSIHLYLQGTHVFVWVKGLSEDVARSLRQHNGNKLPRVGTALTMFCSPLEVAIVIAKLAQGVTCYTFTIGPVNNPTYSKEVPVPQDGRNTESVWELIKNLHQGE